MVCKDGSFQYYKNVDVSKQKELPYTLWLFNWTHRSALGASANGLVFCRNLNIRDGHRVEYCTDGVPESQPMFDFLERRKQNPPSVPLRVKMMNRLCKVVYQLQRDGFVHRDLHSRNVLLSETGNVSVIDYDLVAYVGGVDGLPAEKQLQQSFPTVFSAWGQVAEYIHPYYDSQQIAVALASLFLWENVSPTMPSAMTDLFPDYDPNRCVVCQTLVTRRSKGCCGCDKGWCRAVILRFNSLWTWPLHLQRPQNRCTEYTSRMIEFMKDTKAGPRMLQRMRDACVRAQNLPALLYDRILGAGVRVFVYCV